MTQIVYFDGICHFFPGKLQFRINPAQGETARLLSCVMKEARPAEDKALAIVQIDDALPVPPLSYACPQRHCFDFFAPCRLF